jgi:hypothetical protein
MVKEHHLDVSGNFMFNEKFVVGIALQMERCMPGRSSIRSLYLGYGYDGNH